MVFFSCSVASRKKGGIVSEYRFRFSLLAERGVWERGGVGDSRAYPILCLGDFLLLPNMIGTSRQMGSFVLPIITQRRAKTDVVRRMELAYCCIELVSTAGSRLIWEVEKKKIKLRLSQRSAFLLFAHQ